MPWRSKSHASNMVYQCSCYWNDGSTNSIWFFYYNSIWFLYSITKLSSSYAITHHSCDLHPTHKNQLTGLLEVSALTLPTSGSGHRIFTQLASHTASIRLQLLPTLHKQPQVHTYLQIHYTQLHRYLACLQHTLGTVG